MRSGTRAEQLDGLVDGRMRVFSVLCFDMKDIHDDSHYDDASIDEMDDIYKSWRMNGGGSEPLFFLPCGRFLCYFLKFMCCKSAGWMLFVFRA